ncbi:MAG: aldehyde dehydrogenase [Candidatus Gracilibacteria bacterium]|nr:aldehyde dehydrogenase [Candidatus Gracilibacteria bacterium]
MTKLISTNPSNNFEVLGEVEITSEAEIIEIVQKSKIAQKLWAKISLDERLNHLHKVYKNFLEKKEELSILVSEEMGMPIKLSRIEIESGLNYFKWSLDNAHKYLDPKTTFETETEIHKIHYMAKGVAGIMIPWNFPFSIFIRQSIQSLLVGNSVVLKHSKETCLFGKEIEKVFLEADFPTDVFSEIYGSSEVADILVAKDIDMIGFTGSTRVGKSLYKIAAEKFIPIVMELGGSAPGIVFGDVKVDDVVETIFAKRFFYSGQVCDGLKRLIVHESIYDEMQQTKILLYDH